LPRVEWDAQQLINGDDTFMEMDPGWF